MAKFRATSSDNGDLRVSDLRWSTNSVATLPVPLMMISTEHKLQHQQQQNCGYNTNSSKTASTTPPPQPPPQPPRGVHLRRESQNLGNRPQRPIRFSVELDRLRGGSGCSAPTGVSTKARGHYNSHTPGNQ